MLKRYRWVGLFGCLTLIAFGFFALARLSEPPADSPTLPTLAVLPQQSAAPATSAAAASQPILDLQTVTAHPSAVPSATAQPEQASVPNRAVIQFDQPGERAAYAEQMRALGANVTAIDALNTLIVDLPGGTPVENLPPLPASAVAEPDYYVTALHAETTSVNDPLYAQQWGVAAVGAADAWHHLSAETPPVTVAVIDGGICADHPDLAGRVLPGRDYVDGDDNPADSYGHGCAVSGIIAANLNDGFGMAGLAPNTRILPLRVLDGSGVGRYSSVAAALVYAADSGARVINLSLGGPNPSSTLENAVNYAAQRGVTIVAAAGNTGQPSALYPARYPAVIAVGSVDVSLQRSSFSNHGNDVDLWAPGRDILSTRPDGSHGLQSGTSFAAPHVSAIAALEIMTGDQLTLGGLVRFGGGTPVIDPPAGTPINPPLSGVLRVIYGDPQDASQPHVTVIILSDDNGGNTQLVMSLGEAIRFNGRRVEVTGTPTAIDEALAAAESAIRVATIRPLDAAAQGEVSAALAGTARFVTLLCRFPATLQFQSIDPPHAETWYSALFDGAYPGLNHFWQQTSYGNINLTGSTVIEQWFTLPHPEAVYMQGNGLPNWDKIVTDCTNLADSSVNFPDYYGINIMLNGEIGGAAWGGRTRELNLDGVRKVYGATWMPPWAQMPGVLAHEIGHTFGLPHSSGPYSQTYDSRWDVMSGGGMVTHWYTDLPTILYIPLGTIGYHLALLDWIPANRQVIVNPGERVTVTLERLQLPQNPDNPLLAIIPIPGSSQFYTVEARYRAGYDNGFNGSGGIPDNAVIIHHVDPNRLVGGVHDRLAQVVDADGNGSPNDPGARWVIGESFIDPVYDICVTVVSADLTSFTVTISSAAEDVVQVNLPADGDTRSITPELTWDALAGVDSYTLQLSRDPNFTEGVLTFNDLQATAFTPAPELADGVWYWRVRPLVNWPCLWSEARSFTLNSTAPMIVRAEPSTPTLTWNRVSGATAYQVQINRTTSMTIPYDEYVTPDGETLSYTTIPLEDGLWYWRVRARQPNGLWGSWSAYQTLIVSSSA